MTRDYNPHINALSEADVFWRRVDRSGICWYWTGAQNAGGYGRICIDQAYYPAHKVAWFLVNGQWPQDTLYRQCPLPLGRRQHDPRLRLCVRPDHMRDGLVSQNRRWYGSAENGFPPEFRKVADDLLPTDKAQADLMPLLLYKGSLSIGRAQALFNWTMVVQAAEAVELGDIARMSAKWPDAAHAVGLHKPITAPRQVAQFWGRMLNHPAVTDLRPGMRDYIQTTLAKSGVQPIRLQRISRYSPWTTRDWRKPPRLPKSPRIPKYVRPPLEPLAEVWPFAPADLEHDLVLRVDAAVPKGIPELVRQDVCQDLILAVLEGEMKVTELAGSVGEFTKRAFRLYPSKYGPLSLDAPLGDSNRTIGDTLADAPIILGGEAVDWGRIRDLVAVGAEP